MVYQGIDLMGIGGRRNHNHPIQISPLNHAPNMHQQEPINFPFQEYSLEPHKTPETWAFLENFEHHFGSMHPFFYACSFREALKIAQDDHKFLFVYLHSPEHPFTPFFCSGTLCSDLVVQFLDANFVSWGALANGGEGLQLASTDFRAQSFPFCALVAPVSGDSMVVLQQMECPVSPAELVEILQRTLEEQGAAFGSERTMDAEKRRMDSRLKEEQDVAYMTSLTRDQENEKRKNLAEEVTVVDNVANVSSRANHVKPNSSPLNQKTKEKDAKTDVKIQQIVHAAETKNVPTTQILIRFPNGERKEQTFLCTDEVQEIYRYINSLGLLGKTNYKLVSNFPKKVYGIEQMGMSLKDASLHPKASLFIELL
ncbi:hypothetical protein Leryth_006554 [Lithospermum erythrorhizon]|nr:hypothetical protein Leryth_006554 [Lithospermum erythrorhizon]